MDITGREPYAEGERVYFYNPDISSTKFYGYIMSAERRHGSWAYWIKFDKHGAHFYINYGESPLIFPEVPLNEPHWEV